MSDQDRDSAVELFTSLLGKEMGERAANAANSNSFAKEVRSLALDNVFAKLWTRPGLSPRDRSLVTIGILIALRAENELKHHFRIAIKNGLTREEIEEAVYQSTGYAGFPAASLARDIGEEIFDA